MPFIDTPRLGERRERRNEGMGRAACSLVVRWTLRLCLMITGVGLGIALAAGTAYADATPLGKGADRLAGNAKKVAGSVVKKKAPTARPKAVRKPAQRPAAKPAKRVVRNFRPQARPTRIAPKPRVRIPSPERKKVASPVRSTIKKSRPGTIVKKAPAKINKRVAKKIDKPAVKKKIDQPRKKIDKAAGTVERSTPKPLPADPAAIRLPAVDQPAVDLPSLLLPSIELPAIELPAVKLPAVKLPAVNLPTGEIPPGQRPAVPPEMSGPTLVRSVPGSPQPGIRSADPPATPALDPVRPPPAEVKTPAIAAAMPVHLLIRGLPATLLQSIATFANETLAGSTPTSVGTSAALILAATIGLAASSSASANTSGWAGMALLPAALHLSAVGVRRRFSAALRLSASRIGYRPAFAPD